MRSLSCAIRLSCCAQTGAAAVRLGRMPLRAYRTSVADLRKTDVFIDDASGDVFRVEAHSHSKQARQKAVVQVQIRDLRRGSVTTRRFRPMDTVEVADVEKATATVVTTESVVGRDQQGGKKKKAKKKGSKGAKGADEVMLVLHNEVTGEDMRVPERLVAPYTPYLYGGTEVTVVTLEHECLQVLLPPHVLALVQETEPYQKGSSSSPTYKPARLSNGCTLMVPPYVDNGTVIRVDTTNERYAGRGEASEWQDCQERAQAIQLELEDDVRV